MSLIKKFSFSATTITLATLKAELKLFSSFGPEDVSDKIFLVALDDFDKRFLLMNGNALLDESTTLCQYSRAFFLSPGYIINY